jgi:hypothetical protein
VAATILGRNSNGSFNVQHYWVTAAGDTITLKAGCADANVSNER